MRTKIPPIPTAENIIDTDFWIVFYAVYTSAICRQNNGPTAGDLGAAFVT
jgi:hypothetical protein